MKGYRTILFNLLMSVMMLGATWGIDTGLDEGSVNAFLDALDVVITFVWGIGNLWLRAITDTPVGQKV